MPKILILILSCKHPVYMFLSEEGIEKTWNSISVDNINTYYYYGGHDNSYHDQKNIYLKSADGYNSITKKTIEAFAYSIKNFQFDYIFRTNSSSYIDKNKLNFWLKDKPKKNFYSGVIGNNSGVAFASGCGYTISKDLVEKIVQNQDKVNTRLIDDVAVSHFLNTEITRAPRKDTMCNTSMNYETDKHFHWRCKCPQDRRIDVQHMHNIHKELFNEL